MLICAIFFGYPNSECANLIISTQKSVNPQPKVINNITIRQPPHAATRQRLIAMLQYPVQRYKNLVSSFE